MSNLLRSSDFGTSGLMKQESFARPLLEHWGFSVDDIPPSAHCGVKEADFKATLADVVLLIEEKTKAESPIRTRSRNQAHHAGRLHFETLPLTRDETVSGVIRRAAAQLKSSARHTHHFRVLWFTATGSTAEGKYEQFMATLYGRTNIIEMNSDGYRPCYFFHNGDFYHRRAVLDGAIASYTDGSSITAKFCLNPLSPRFHELRQSAVLKPFGSAVVDPLWLESEGTAFVVDSDLDRQQEGALLDFLQKKYRTGPLMKIDLGYTRASIRVDRT